MVVTLLPSLRSRTVPMKLHTAPTRLSLACRAAISSLRLKSWVWMVTRSAMASASGDGGEERHLGAVDQGLRLVAHDLVQRHPHRLAAGQALRMGAAAGDQFV